MTLMSTKIVKAWQNVYTENSEDFDEELQEISERFLTFYVRPKIVETQRKPQVDQDKTDCTGSRLNQQHY